MNGKFNELGNEYILREKKTKLPLFNYHFNKFHYMTVANNLFGESRSILPMGYTFNNSFRYVFVKDKNKVYSIGNTAIDKNQVVEISTTYNLESTKLQSTFDSIKVETVAFVPQNIPGEIFKYTFTNTLDKETSVDVAIIYSMESSGMGVTTNTYGDNRVIACQSLPYHAKYEGYEESKKYKHTAFTAVSEKPDRVCVSELACFDGIEHNGENVFNSHCITTTKGENSVACFIFKLSLQPNEKKCISTYTSLAYNLSEVQDNVNKYFDILVKTDDLLRETKEYFDNITNEKYSYSKDININNFASFWAKKQVLCMYATRRRTRLYCVRNSLQDGLGLSYIDKDKAKEYFKETIALQQSEGWIRQHGIWGDIYPVSGLGTMVMRDGPSWLLLCISLYINDSKDYSFVNEVVRYKDGGEGSMLEHLLKAIQFMWNDRGMYGLSLLGDGDWTDPINGPGRNGKGVSTWTSMAFVFGMKEFAKVLKSTGYNNILVDVESKIKEMEDNILSACYKDNQFIAGYNDDGVAYGCREDSEGSLFLNMHSWAILCGVAKGEIKDRCIDIIKSLILPFGAVLIKPSFSEWNDKFGRISIKSQGTTENGSAYCHASLFAVYALLLSGERDLGEKLLRDILPTHDYVADYDTQVPIFIPNYYYALEGSSRFGRSSAENITGSTDWFLKIYNDFFVKKEVE